MPGKRSKHPGYKSLKPSAGKGGDDLPTDKTPGGAANATEDHKHQIESLVNPRMADLKNTALPDKIPDPAKESFGRTASFRPNADEPGLANGPEEDLSFSELRKYEKEKKKVERDFDRLNRDFWLARNGHSLTYAGLFLFSILVLFRPYELVSSLSFLSATAFYFAAITIAFYLPAQLLTEGNLTAFSTEVKAVLLMTLLALVTMPLAKSPGTAWETFNDMFIKAVLMFIVMVNVLRTKERLMGMLWLSLSVGLFLSYTAVNMYWIGELNAEGYRVSVNVGGMFGNPNDLALHLVTMMPLAVVLGIAAKKQWQSILYFAMTALFIGAIAVTYSRSGFLGLIAAGMVLSWKLGRNKRFKILAITMFVGVVFLLVAPGNYGLRMLSIFIPALDPVGSSSQRQDLLMRSILVTLRNPWGIGIGNFPIVGVRNLGTHNAYTQVSSELGILGLAAYLTLMISPFRKLSAIERILFGKSELNWYYYVSIGFQASIVGYMVTSFFAPVAYNWFIYYLIAYAVCFRRIYKIGSDESKVSAGRSES